MPYNEQSPVMDVFPWPNGHGFKGADIWWDYVLGKEESKRLDNLMGLALLDESICRRLVVDRDASLFSMFNLSPETQAWLRAINATTLPQFAEAVTAGPQSQSAALVQAS